MKKRIHWIRYNESMEAEGTLLKIGKKIGKEVAKKFTKDVAKDIAKKAAVKAGKTVAHKAIQSMKNDSNTDEETPDEQNPTKDKVTTEGAEEALEPLIDKGGELLTQFAIKTAEKLVDKGAQVATDVAGKAVNAGIKVSGKIAKLIADKNIDGIQMALKKMGDVAIKLTSKMSPATAENLKEKFGSVIKYCVDNGLTGDDLKKYIGDFIEDITGDIQNTADQEIISKIKTGVANTNCGEEALAIIVGTQQEMNTISNQGDSNAAANEQEPSSNDGEQNVAAESTKRLKVTKEFFNRSRYFKTKYGSLKYVSESGNKYKTTKGKVLMFK